MPQGRTPNSNRQRQTARRNKRKAYATFESRSVAIIAAWTMAISGAVYAQTGAPNDQNRPDEALLASWADPAGQVLPR